ncbi:MAG: CBS domain-containing protein [Bryobacteraceae bacterium]|nr:CBS domain-containing protein [Bryobacteraceae bacterium]
MIRLRNILQDRELFFVEPHQTVLEVAQTMSRLKVGAILVVDGDRLSGIFSERDLMTRVVVPGRDAATTPVGDVMSTHLATIDESATSSEAMERMHEHKCRHLPVLSGGRVTGMISMRDLMDVELENKVEEIQQMRAYIAGSV